MELKDLITIDKTIRRPDVVQQVVSQMIDLIENGLLPPEMSVLPDFRTFAKQLGITPVNGCKIYNQLNMKYGHYNEGGNLVIDCKGQAIQQLQESIKYAVKQGITCDEMIKIIVDNI
ncbi:MAG: hypothetical protein ACI4JS_01005 [Oscillospiraceae bacterium]